MGPFLLEENRLLAYVGSCVCESVHYAKSVVMVLAIM